MKVEMIIQGIVIQYISGQHNPHGIVHNAIIFEQQYIQVLIGIKQRNT
jgi:hypothetical protein